MLFGKYEIGLIALILFLILLEVIGRPFCAVCFFGGVTPMESRKGIFHGVIAREPEVGVKSQKFVITAKEGNILVVANRYEKFSYGDEVEARSSKGNAPFNESYEAYLLRNNIRGSLYFPEIKIVRSHQGSPFWGFLYRTKETLRKPIIEGLPEPHAAFLLAMTLGDQWRIPPAFKQALVNSGTVHIVSISGFHMTLITAGVFVLFLATGFKRPLATLATGIVIIFYVLFIGAPASAVRSAIMGLAALIAYLAGRVSRMFYALLLTAFSMLLWDIRFIHDIGFQLSFAAMAGLIIYYPLFRDFVYNNIVYAKKYKMIIGTFLASLAASLTTFPITAYHFGKVSFMAPLANIAILPFFPPILILGFFAEMSGWFIQPLWLFLEYQIRVITLFGSIFS